jgi:hypothetical protein
MKRPIAEHAARFSQVASECDEGQDDDEDAACDSLAVAAAEPGPAETVPDLDTETGANAVALTPDAGQVIGRDSSEGLPEPGPRRFVHGDLWLSASVKAGGERSAHAVDDPATHGMLPDVLTDAGVVATASECIGDQHGVLVADRLDP